MLQLQALRSTPRASSLLRSTPTRGHRRRRVTLQALERLAPLPRAIAALRSDFIERGCDDEHDGVPAPMEGDVAFVHSRPHDLFDLSGDFDLPSNDNRSEQESAELAELRAELETLDLGNLLPSEVGL